MVLRCAWGTCNNDERYPERMSGCRFIPFPKPKTQFEKCLRWIKACGRPHDQLNIGRINKHKAVCSKGDISIAYDAPNKRIAAHMFMTTGGFTTSVIVILNYAEGVQYTISESNCTRTPLKSFAPECIPSDAKLVRSSYLGPPSNKMMINTYTYMRGNLEIAATVTDNTCVPVGEIIQGSTGGEYVMQSVGFSGISAGISKPSVFIPPSSCSNSPLVSVNQNAIHNRLLRRYLNLVP